MYENNTYYFQIKIKDISPKTLQTLAVRHKCDMRTNGDGFSTRLGMDSLLD